MSSHPLYLPALAQPHQITVPKRLLTKAKLSVWSFAALIFLAVLVASLDLSWLTDLWQLTFFVFAAIAALTVPEAARLGSVLPVLVSCLMPALGVAQMLIGRTAYKYACLEAVLYWTIFPASFLLGLILMRDRSSLRSFFAGLWFLAAAVTAMELYQLTILGRFAVLASGLPLMSSNLYAELAELLLPVVLYKALCNGARSWLSICLVAIMIGACVASGARMGSALLLIETIAALALARRLPGYEHVTWRRHGLPLLACLLLSLGLVGTQFLSGRLQQAHPFGGRDQILASGIAMVRQHPWSGFGLGSFPVVYPAYDRLQMDTYVNHMHNDYVELASEGGAGAFLIWLSLLAICIRPVLRAPWAIGTIAVVAHGVVDFPVYRSPVLALLAALFAAAGAAESGRKRVPVPQEHHQPLGLAR